MCYSLLADLIVVLHLLFIIFVIGGGLLVLWRRWIAWLHLPAAVWGAFIEFMGWICPLTPLENKFRHLAGQHGYTGDFTEHYLIPLIYPNALTREIQIMLGVFVLAVNIAVHYLVYKKAKYGNNLSRISPNPLIFYSNLFRIILNFAFCIFIFYICSYTNIKETRTLIHKTPTLIINFATL